MSDTDRKATYAKVAEILDDPDLLVSLLERAMQRHPEQVQEALAKFATMGELHSVIQENAPKINQWMCRASTDRTVSNVCDQLITYTVGTLKNHLSAIRAEGLDAIQSMEDQVAALSGNSEVGSGVHRTAECSRGSFLAVLAESERDIIGGVKKQTLNVKDTCSSAVEAAILRIENAILRVQH